MGYWRAPRFLTLRPRPGSLQHMRRGWRRDWIPLACALVVAAIGVGLLLWSLR